MKKKYICLSVCICLTLTGFFLIKNNDTLNTSKIETSKISTIGTENSYRISDDDILYEIEYDSSFAIDINDLQDMYDKSSKVYIVDNLIEEGCKYIRKGDPIPNTVYSANTVKLLKGDEDVDTISIGLKGGYIPMNEYIENLDDMEKLKFGVDNISGEDMDKYAKITSDEYVELSNNSKYIVFLGYDEDINFYNILCGGYGIYEYNENDSTITNKLLDKSENLNIIKFK